METIQLLARLSYLLLLFICFLPCTVFLQKLSLTISPDIKDDNMSISTIEQMFNMLRINVQSSSLYPLGNFSHVKASKLKDESMMGGQEENEKKTFKDRNTCPSLQNLSNSVMKDVMRRWLAAAAELGIPLEKSSKPEAATQSADADSSKFDPEGSKFDPESSKFAEGPSESAAGSFPGTGRRLHQFANQQAAALFRLIFGNFLDLVGGGNKYLANLLYDLSFLLQNINFLNEFVQFADAPIENAVNAEYFPLPQSNTQLLALIIGLLSDFCFTESLLPPRQVIIGYREPSINVTLQPPSCPITPDPKTGKLAIQWDQCSPAMLLITQTPSR